MTEKTHYYSLGLAMAGISSKAIGKLDIKKKFNDGTELQHKEFSDGSGLELYETPFRMYDPQIGRWHVKDAKSEAYTSWSSYNYALNNPLKYVDPDGNDVYLIIWGSNNGEIGHAGMAVDNYRTEKYRAKEKYKDETGKMRTRTVEKERQVKDETVTYYDLWPGNDEGVGKSNFSQNVKGQYNKQVTTLDQLYNTDVTGSEGKPADGIVKIQTDAGGVADTLVKSGLQVFQNANPSYNGLNCNCSDYAKEGVQYAAQSGSPLTNYREQIGQYTSSTPNQLYKATITLPNAAIIKDPGTKVEKKFIEAVTGGGTKQRAAEKMID